MKKRKVAAVGLTAERIQEAREYAADFPANARRKGAAYFAERKVAPLVPNPIGEIYFDTRVRGSEWYDLSIFYGEEGWDGTCSCPMEYDCKHLYAAFLALLATVSPAEPSASLKASLATRTAAPGKGATPSAPVENFRALAERKLGRTLTAAEAKSAKIVQSVYDRSAGSETVPESSVAELYGRPQPWSWHSFQIWPRRPKDEWETWLYLAHFLRSRQHEYPPFLTEITDAGEVDALVGPWMREQAVAEWQKRLAAAHLKARPTTNVLELRVVFGRREAQMESRSGQEGWQILKSSRHQALDRDMRYGEAGLTPAARSVWSAFHYGGATAATLLYDNPTAVPALGHLLSNPLLTELVLTDARVPFQRPEQPLVWKMDAPDDEQGDYRFALERADGEPLPPPVLVINGADPLYVTSDVIFRAPTLGGLPLAVGRATTIPAAALESRQGLSVLDATGLPLPPRLVPRVRRRKATLVIEAALATSHFADQEHLEVRVLAEWGEGEKPQEWSIDGWSARKDKAAAAPDALILDDVSALAETPMIVARLGAVWSGYAHRWERKVSKKFPEQFSEWLLSLPEYVELRLDKELASLRGGPVSGTVSLEVESAGMDWFDLTVDLKVPDLDLTKEELQALLSAQGGWVRLGQRGWQRLALQLSDEEEADLAEMGLSPRDLGSGEKQRLHTLQLAHAGAERMLTEDRVAELRQRARELKASVSPPLPGTITADLRPYQIEGFHFLAYLSTNRFGGLLADDMGLGKTLQTLAWLMWLREQPEFKGSCSLVVCPKSVMENWQSEAARFSPALRVQLWRGRSESELPEVVKECDVLVMNFSQLRVVLARIKAVSWHAVILDEAQAIKNPDSQTAQAARALTADHRLALTGTPIENRLLDLWSIMAFVMPGMLGTRARFARTYDTKDDPLSRRRLAARTRPFLLRRTKEEVAKDLPERVEEELVCEMEGVQATLYRAELKARPQGAARPQKRQGAR